jgi:hypothetical protein
MTETPRATVCPKDYCRALIPATQEDRAAHLAGHASTEKSEKFIRSELIAIRTLIAELKDDNRDFRTELRSIEIPAPTDPLVIEDWPDDELPTEDEDDTTSTYATDDVAATVTIDASDLPTAGADLHGNAVDMYGNRVTT